MDEKLSLLPTRTRFESKSIEEENELSINEILKYTGELGLFQWLLYGVFGIMMMTQTYQILIMYFAGLSPEWRCVANSTFCDFPINTSFSANNKSRCSMPRSAWEFSEPKDFSIVTQFDLHCGNQWQVYLATSVFFIGWAAGSVLLGWIADNHGRKLTLFPSNMLVLFFGFAAAFSPNIWLFLLLRFLSGFFIAGCFTQMIIISAELSGTKHRPIAVITLFFFFTIALCLLGLKAYYIRNWKTLFITITAPYFFVIVFYKFVPESVRWLNLHGHQDGVIRIFKRMAKWNGKVVPDNIIPTAPSEKARIKSSPLDLFANMKMIISTGIQGYVWLVCGMVYYSLSLAASDLGHSLYRNFVLLAAVEFPALFIAIYLCKRFGRKFSAVIPMLCTCVACGIVAFTQAGNNLKILRLVVAMLGKMAIVVSYDSLGLWSGELYPTVIRVEAINILQVCSRIGAACSPWVATGLELVYDFLPFTFMAIATLIAAVLAWWLPETKEKDLPEVLEEEDGNRK